MEQKLAELEEDMINWKVVLNEEGIWLFLATLGSWSVPRGWLQFFAFMIVVFFFSWRASSQLKSTKSFPERSKTLEDKIRNEISDETKQKAFLYDLMLLKARNTSLRSMKDAVPYMVSFLFWTVSFLYFLSVWK